MTTTFALHGGDSSPTCALGNTEAAKTISEHAGSRRPWFMPVCLASRPRCFGCGGRMLPKVVVVKGNYAICEKCSFVDWSKLHAFWDAIESLGSPCELTRARGIVFWTPPASLPDTDAYLRWMELWEIMAGTSARRILRHL